MLILQKARQKILKQPRLGLRKMKDDPKDLGFFGLNYKPKHKRKVLECRKVKSQHYNTCGWVASAGAKEIDERVDLDERTLVMFGRREGMIRGDGYSNLRDNEKVLQKCGIARKGLLKSDFRNFDEYSDPKQLTPDIVYNASKHKSKTYRRVKTISQLYKAIDDERPVKIGIRWYTKYNMSGGFSLPWILQWLVGLLVGGHAMFVRGYDTDYEGEEVAIVRNSFGNWYGNKGDLYIKMENLQKEIDLYGAFANTDEDLDIAKWVDEHDGMVVKAEGDADVYLIKDGEKKKFPDLATLYAHDHLDQDIIEVERSMLVMVKKGEDMDFWNGQMVKGVKAIIQQRKHLNDIFSKYFKELF